MKYVIITDCDLQVTEVENREAYDKLTYSEAGYQRELNAKPGQHMQLGCLRRYKTEPEQFPCLLMEVDVVPVDLGPDDIIVKYFYHYKAVQ